MALQVQRVVSQEDIHAFLQGNNPMQHIIRIECGYDDSMVTIFYRDERGVRRTAKDNLYPFCWAKQSAGRGLFNGDRSRLKRAMNEFHIGVKALITADINGNEPPRMRDGYNVLFYARVPMTYARFQRFFSEGGRPLYPKRGDINDGLREYIVINPVEQYMIHSKRRQFKGYEDYDELVRLEWDLETTGLDPKVDRITKFGIRTNKGFEKILTVTGNTHDELMGSEMAVIMEAFDIVKEINPDVMTGHNTENFDWNFIDVRLSVRGLKMREFTKRWFREGVYKKKKQQVLKLGQEMEYFCPTVMSGCHLTDSLHAVRRAQAIDSSMKKADLKYVTRYSSLNKPNRVYVPGKHIGRIGDDTRLAYAHNDTDGEWFEITQERLGRTFATAEGVATARYRVEDSGKVLVDAQTGKRYDVVTGVYIIDRYLKDDLYEGDRVEHRYNLSNFLVCKMLPVSFDKVCTMGTAAIWKYIMLAWSYENGLAVPALIDTHKFTGGLSRLLKVGYVDRIVKLDYNSLYPSILLTFNIQSPIDIMGSMLAMLLYVLTQREYYKGLKGKNGKLAKKTRKEISETAADNLAAIEELKKMLHDYEQRESLNDKLQLPLKITGNAYFGSFGSGSVFPWSDMEAAEEVTCTGRMMLRLMIYHFSHIADFDPNDGVNHPRKTGESYVPIVGDSVTGDTPLFVKDKNGRIDIVPIADLFDTQHAQADMLGREYDTSTKNYHVLCRSGWVEPTYIYRHKVSKPIYRVTDGSDTLVDVTQDHSLYDANQAEIRPSEITDQTQLEYYSGNIYTDFNTIEDVDLTLLPTVDLLNATISQKFKWLKMHKAECEAILTSQAVDKVLMARIFFIQNCVKHGSDSTCHLPQYLEP